MHRSSQIHGENGKRHRNRHSHPRQILREDLPCRHPDRRANNIAYTSGRICNVSDSFSIPNSGPLVPKARIRGRGGTAKGRLTENDVAWLREWALNCVEHEDSGRALRPDQHDKIRVLQDLEVQ